LNIFRDKHFSSKIPKFLTFNRQFFQ